MIVDIRKFSKNETLFEFQEAAKVSRNWYGKIKDNYWDFLDKKTILIDVELNFHIIVDFLTYLDQEKDQQMVLEADSNKLSELRGSGILIMDKKDVEDIVKIVSEVNFNIEFEQYSKDMDGELYDFTPDALKENVSEFIKAIKNADNEYFIIINLG